jgi:methionyl-tRNA formyltransferase
MKLAVLVSGNIGFNVLKYIHSNKKICFVLTDKKSINIINFCNDNKIDLFVGCPRSNKLNNFLENREIDVLISVNYLFLINKNLISLPNRIAFNIHGSLLPKYRGRTPHVWAIINNEKETGITAHQIDKGCDTGKIIEQIKVPILENDTGGIILDKFNKLYPILVESVLNKIETDTVILKQQNDSKSMYFGKRTPENGRIDWEWSKERIFNWIRAQADPYPGAFTYYNQHKVIIDNINYTDYGYNYNMKNGLILSTSPLLIKTTNGVIKVVKMRNVNLVFKINEVFN